MSEMPSDIQFKAKAALCGLADEYETSLARGAAFWSGDASCDIIARAILAERERCAKIAETFARDLEPSFMADAGWDIAGAIRANPSE